VTNFHGNTYSLSENAKSFGGALYFDSPGTCKVQGWRLISGCIKCASESAVCLIQASYCRAAQIARSNCRTNCRLPCVFEDSAATIFRLFPSCRQLSLRPR